MMINRPYKVQNGNNNPIQAPFYKSPFTPYKCTNFGSVSVYAEVEPELIKKYLEPTPFEYISSVFNISISDFSNTDGYGGFYDCSFVIPVKYKDLIGGYTMFEYESEDFAIAAGRELWGYPKEYAKMDFIDSTEKVLATASKRGKEFVRIEFTKNSVDKIEIPDVKLTPHLQVQVVPNAEGPGVFLKRVLQRDTSPDYKSRIYMEGETTLTLKFDGKNPLDEFASAKIIGGTYTRGEWASTEENGWAKVVDTLIKPKF